MDLISIDFDKLMQLLNVLGVVGASAVTTRWGYVKISRELKSYVTVKDYAEKMEKLHGAINSLSNDKAVLFERTAQLERELAFLQSTVINLTAAMKR